MGLVLGYCLFQSLLFITLSSQLICSLGADATPCHGGCPSIDQHELSGSSEVEEVASQRQAPPKPGPKGPGGAQW